MSIRLVDVHGNPAESAVKLKLQNMLQRIRASGKLMQDSMSWTVKNHFTTIYPGSQHYSPSKVKAAGFSDGSTPTATVDIDVPGVTRAYHDMHIRPRFKSHLTIPIHRSSYGKSAGEFRDLIYIKKKNGTELLAQKTGGGLVFLYVLKDYVF